VYDDTSVLARLMGQSGSLRAAGAAEPRRIIRAGEDALVRLEVSVVGHEDGVLRIESTDSQILGLDGRAVVVDFGSGAERLHLSGSLELLTPMAPFLAALHPVMLPDGLQRRRAVRVPTQLIVRLALDEDPPHRMTWYTTKTCDLSAGGVRLITVGDLLVGQRIRIALELSAEPLEVAGTVLDVLDDGTSRIRFLDVSDSDSLRLQRFTAAVQTR